MDLVEYREQRRERHFWESARIRFVEFVLKRYITEELSAADIGSGDCYAISRLMKEFSFRHVWAKDPYWKEPLLSQLKEKYPGIAFDNLSEGDDLSSMPGSDICFMLDVLEHIEHDREFLAALNRKLNQDGLLMITVPAYNFLFSEHDVFLKHFRRYNRTELCGKLSDASFNTIDSGYFFFSLVLIRLLQKLFHVKDGNKVGKGGPSMLNSLFAGILYCDARICYLLHRIGIVLPGLSCWAIAVKKRPAEIEPETGRHE